MAYAASRFAVDRDDPEGVVLDDQVAFLKEVSLFLGYRGGVMVVAGSSTFVGSPPAWGSWGGDCSTRSLWKGGVIGP